MHLNKYTYTLLSAVIFLTPLMAVFCLKLLFGTLYLRMNAAVFVNMVYTFVLRAFIYLYSFNIRFISAFL